MMMGGELGVYQARDLLLHPLALGASAAPKPFPASSFLGWVTRVGHFPVG